MAKEWHQICKDCGKPFGYSDTSYEVGQKKGLSRPERCPEHRRQHSQEIQSLASSHFGLVPRKIPRSLLGNPYLGHVDHGKRGLKEKTINPDFSGMDLGLNEDHILEIYKALEDHQVLVIVAPTGSGKSTLIPYRLLDPLPGYKIDHFTKYGPIIVTQPRIAATRGIPNVVAQKLYGCSVGPGFEVGFRHGSGGRKGKSDGSQYDETRNRLIFVTDGSLLNWIADGKSGNYSIIVIDEAHERSCTIDLILGLLKRELLKYPYLKLLVLSATIDADRFKEYFAETSSVWLRDFNECEKTYDYTHHWWTSTPISEENMPFKVAEKILKLLGTTNDAGGILAFLPGQKEIDTAVDIVSKQTKNQPVVVYPLYTALKTHEIDKALNPIKKRGIGGKEITLRRVVIATNIAETSLTIPDVAYVVDSGLIKQTEWNPATCRQKLITRWHSQDGCRQRWGRAGRNRPGKVYTLYTEEQFRQLPEHTPPAITRECLDDVMLKAKIAGVNDINKFSWLESPPDVEVNRANTVLKERRLIDFDNDITDDGQELYRIAQSVSGLLDAYDYNSTQRSLDVATLLQLADKYACLPEAATALSMMPRMGEALYWKEDGLLQWNRAWDLETKDKISRIHNSLRAGCEDDLDFALKLFSLYEEQLSWLPEYALDDWSGRHFINEQGFELAFSAREALLDVFTKGKKSDAIRTPNLASYDRVRLLMAVAWPDRVVTLKSGTPLIFPAPYSEGVGILSRYSCGNWKSDDKAIVAMMDKGQLFLNGKFTHCPVGNFLIRPPREIPSNDPVDIAIALSALKSSINEVILQQEKFADQIIPVGSRVEVNGGDTGIIKHLINQPKKVQPIIIVSDAEPEDHTHDDSYDLYDHKDGGMGTQKQVKTNFRVSRDIKKQNDFIEAIQYKCICDGECNSTINRIMSWSTYKHKPVSLISSIQPNKLSKHQYKQGKSIELIIDRPILDMHSNQLAGFIAHDSDGFEVPLPISELSISKFNDALLRLNKQKISLFVADNSKERKYPLLTLLPNIENDLNQLANDDEVEGTITSMDYYNGRGFLKIGINRNNNIIHTVIVPFDNLPEKFRIINPNERIIVNIIRSTTKYNRKPSAKLMDIQLNRHESAYLHDYNIIVTDTHFKCDDPLIYDTYTHLREKFPKLDFILRRLYECSHQLSAIIVDTEETYQAFLAIYNDACMVRDAARTANPAKTRDNVKRLRSNIDYEILSKSSIGRIKKALDEAWQTQSRVQNEKNRQPTTEFVERKQRENEKLRTWIRQTSDYSKISKYEGFIGENDRKIANALEKLNR